MAMVSGIASWEIGPGERPKKSKLRHNNSIEDEVKLKKIALVKFFTEDFSKTEL